MILNTDGYILKCMDSEKAKSMADVLREAVMTDGRSLYRLARDADIPYPVLYRFMRGDKAGRRQSLNLGTVDKLANAVGLELLPKRKA